MTAPRVGLFGLLGSANIGNEAQLESVLAYLRTDHPEAVLDAMSSGPENVRAKYGIDAIPLLWYEKYEERTSGAVAVVLKVLGKGIDAFRTASWVPPARCGDRAWRGHAGGGPAAAAVGCSVLDVPPVGLRPAVRNEGGPGQCGGQCHQAAGHAVAVQVRCAAGFLSFLPRRSVARSRAAVGARHLWRPCVRRPRIRRPGPAVQPWRPADRRCRRHGLLRRQRRPQACGRDSRLLSRQNEAFHPVAGRQWLSGPAVRRGQPLGQRRRAGNSGRRTGLPARSRARLGGRRAGVDLSPN